jgi:hypothetical protein
LENKLNQAGWFRVKVDKNPATGFKSWVLLLCLIALIVPFVAYGVQAEEPTRAAPSKEERPAAYVWSATRIESSLLLRGSVPSEEDRRTVLGMVKAHFPDLQVEDRLKIAEGSPPQEQWLGAVSFSLKQLSYLKRGSVRLLNVSLKIDGEARTANDYAEAKKALAGLLPTGLTINGESIRPPIAKPFTFVADLGTNALSLSGSVPSEGSRKHLRELSRQLFERPGLDDRLEVASGAPKDWDEAVTAALKALSRLESGKIAMSGVAVTIEGVAPDEGTAVAVSYQLKRDLPAMFSTSESISWKETAAPTAQSEFAARVIPRIKALARNAGQLPHDILPPLLSSP